MECQLTGLAGFDYLLDRSQTKTDGHDTRADDLTKRCSNKYPKTKSIPKAAERDRGRTPKRLSGRLRDRSALDFSFSFVCGAGVCLSRRAQRADLYKTSTRQGAKRRFLTKKPGLYVNEGSVSLRLFAFINGQLNAISFVSLFKTRYS